MVEFISSWSKQVILSLIIVVIFELIIPNGRNKKYIKLIMGLFVLYSIINPIVRGKISKINFKSFIDDSNIKVSQNSVSSQALIDKNVETLYDDNIKNDISSFLDENGYITKNIRLDVNYEDENNYGSIRKIELSIFKKMINDNSSIVINKISIDNDGVEGSSISDSEIENIKSLISNRYSILKENIIIGR